MGGADDDHAGKGRDHLHALRGPRRHRRVNPRRCTIGPRPSDRRPASRGCRLEPARPRDPSRRLASCLDLSIMIGLVAMRFDTGAPAALGARVGLNASMIALGRPQERSLVGGPWPVSDRLRGRCHRHGDVRALAARTQRSPKPARFVQVIFGSLPQRLALCRQPTAPTRAPGRSSPSLWRRPTPIAIDPGSPKGSGDGALGRNDTSLRPRRLRAGASIGPCVVLVAKVRARRRATERAHASRPPTCPPHASLSAMGPQCLGGSDPLMPGLCKTVALSKGDGHPSQRRGEDGDGGRASRSAPHLFGHLDDQTELGDLLLDRDLVALDR